MIMIHSDDTGLVLPPKVAQTQIVIVPIRYKNDDPTLLNDKAEELAGKLRQAGMRVVVDSSETHNPGFKFAAWEVKGIPARLELGMKDYEKEEVRVAVRHSNKKFQAKWENIEGQMSDLLQTIHNEMYAKAEKARNEHLKALTIGMTSWKHSIAEISALLTGVIQSLAKPQLRIDRRRNR